MKTCPNCGATRFSLGRKTQIWETIVLDHIDDEGNGEEVSNALGDTESPGDWDCAYCYECSENVALALLFPPPEGPTDAQYRALARTAYHRDGAVEIDDNGLVSRGEDGGAYVAAWVWVGDPTPLDAENEI